MATPVDDDGGGGGVRVPHIVINIIIRYIFATRKLPTLDVYIVAIGT